MITLYYDDTSLEVQEDEQSYRYRALMEKPQLVLKFSLTEYIEFPVGTYCYFQSEKFTVFYPQNIVKNGLRNIEYTLTFGTDEEKLSLYKFRNTVDYRLKFSLCCKPHEYLEYIVDNMNEKADSSEEVWEVGDYIDAVAQTIEFNHNSVDEVLQTVADTFETEWEVVTTTDSDTGISTHTINLGKVEYFADSPLSLSYGKGNGFVPGLGRTSESDELPVKRLYVQGGEDNIDSTQYGSQYLLLPKSQSYTYEGRTYKADSNGYYIERTDEDVDAVKEDSLDCSEIYPSYTHTITSWECEDEDDNYYNIYDEDTPDDLDYEECIIGDETMTIIFQSGMLAGREFDVDYTHSKKKWEIVPEDFDGVTMPNSTYCPAVGDTFKVFNVYLPSAYICDNTSHSGASWDMMKEACRYLYENEDQKFTFTGTLQSLWAKRNWENVGGYLKVGAYIHFTDDQFAADGVDIRIIGIKDYLSMPYAPTIEISNSVSGSSVASQLQKISAAEVAIENTERSVIQYTKRRFRDSAETLEMLQDSLLDYSSAIQPITVQTMALLVGDESLQFQFVTSKSDFTTVTYNITYSDDTQQLTCPEGYLKHCTLGISSISSDHDDSEYLCWHMPEFVSGTLSDTSTGYYLYAKVPTDDDEDGEFLLSDEAISMESEDGYYYLLTGILNSEYNGSRSYVDLYGYTEILPGRITTDKIVSSDGNSYLDLVNNALKLGDAFQYNTAGDQELYINGAISQTRKENEIISVTYANYWSSSIPTYSENATVMYGYTTEGIYHYCSFYRSLQALSAYENTIDPPGSNAEQWAPIAENVGVAGNKYFANCLKNTDTTSPSTLAYTVTGTSGGTSLNGPNGGYMRYYTSVTDFLVKMTPGYYFDCGTIQDWGCSFAIKYSSFENIESIRFGFLNGTEFITPYNSVMFWEGYGLAITNVGYDATSNAVLLTALEDTAADYSADTWHRIGWVTDTIPYTSSYGHPVAYINIVCSSGTTIYFAEPLVAMTAQTAEYTYKNFYGTGGNGPSSDYRFCQVWTGRDFDDIFEEGIDTELNSEPVFQGDYDSSETYIGNDEQRDMVLASDQRYYLTTASAGDGVLGIEPPNDTYWEPAGASYSIMGCKWMLGEKGVVGCAKFYNGKVIIEGNVTITGNLTVEGTITGNGITDESE